MFPPYLPCFVFLGQLDEDDTLHTHTHTYKCESESLSVMSDSLRPHGRYSPWNSPGQDTGVGSLSLLQGIFPTQGLNPGLPNCRQILYQLNQKGSLRILEWVAYPFSSGPSWSRNWTRVSCTAGRFFTNWTVREAHIHIHIYKIHIYNIYIVWIHYSEYKKMYVCIIYTHTHTHTHTYIYSV